MAQIAYGLGGGKVSHDRLMFRPLPDPGDQLANWMARNAAVIRIEERPN